MSLLLFTKNTANMMLLIILFAVLVQKEEVQMGEEIKKTFVFFSL